MIGIDKYFIGRNRREKITIVSLLIFSDFSIEGLKNLMINKAIKQIPKLRKKLEYKFFNYYWADVTIEEAIKRIKVIDLDF